jgi:capsular polysaccharide export protein
LFCRLAKALEARGHEVVRINLSGGDRYDWDGEAIDYRGSFSDWSTFVDRIMRKHRVTDLLLFGDCRPYHVKAHGVAKLRSVNTFVLEEGYVRPHWMTLEPDGVNAYSTLRRDKEWLRREAAHLLNEPMLPDVTASFRRRARDAYWHYHHVVTGRLRFPGYRSHRQGSIIHEGFGWLWRLFRQKSRAMEAQRTLEQLRDTRTFVFPLQLSGDFQVRTHSPFADMQGAATYVVESFARHAPAHTHLLIKRHPLDCSFYDWGRLCTRLAASHGLVGRMHLVDGGDLETMLESAAGLVCVNSTSATLALARGIAVCTVGEAIYDMEGLTHQGHLDTFWEAPTAPESGLFDAFRKVLLDRCMVRGGLASESAMNTLVSSILKRLGA